MHSISAMRFIVFALCALSIKFVKGNWCSSGKPTNGTHEQGIDCTFTSEVLVSGFDSYLDIVGKETADVRSPIISRADPNVKHRFFRVDEGATLILSNLILKGGGGE